MSKIIGTDPNQVPSNADLGTMAFQSDHVEVTDLKIINKENPGQRSHSYIDYGDSGRVYRFEVGNLYSGNTYEVIRFKRANFANYIEGFMHGYSSRIRRSFWYGYQNLSTGSGQTFANSNTTQVYLNVVSEGDMMYRIDAEIGGSNLYTAYIEIDFKGPYSEYEVLINH